MLTEKTLLLAKIEATYGTDPTPTTADNALAIHNLSVTPNTTWNERQGMDCSMSLMEGTLGRQYMDITFDYELQGDGDSSLALPCDALLKACGYSHTTATYTPYSSYPAGLSSVTLWMHLDGHLYKTTGARGNVVFNFTAGETAIASFTFQGLYTGGFTEDTFPASCTVETDQPWVAINQALDWNSTGMEAESLSFSLNNTLFARPSLDDADTYGIGGIEITERNGEGSMNPLAVTTVSLAMQTAHLAGTAYPIVYTLANATTKATFTLAKAQITNQTPGDRSGTRIFDIPFKLARSTGDDEISILCAAVT